MNSQAKLASKRRLLLLGGLAAGFLNGLLGAGGGIVIVWILEKVLRDSTHDARDVFANALAVMLPISAMSTVSYAISGGLPEGNISRFLLPAVLGGLLGAFLLDRISTRSVKRLFCLLVILSGIVMVVR
ncbi:MAG: hypothetical protein E7606_01135 [Ruminococcaceae bacterium]|nr:hypothetical protein [Oscillospiraceae bacterium]